MFISTVSGTEMHTKILALPYTGAAQRKKKLFLWRPKIGNFLYQNVLP